MALVCLCNRVSERKVIRTVHHGATTVDEVARACGAGACCRGCHGTIDELIDEHLAVTPASLAVT